MSVCEELDRYRPMDAGHLRTTAAVLAGAVCTAVPVEPWQVHKLRSDEVYLTRWQRTGPDAFRIRARRPQEHPLYRVGSDFDPLLLCETVRQTFPLLCHAAYEVPPGHQLIWDHLRYEVDDAAYAGIDRGPELELGVRCFDLSYRGRRPATLSLRVDISWGAVRVATAEARFAVQSRAVYQRVRGAHADAEAAMAQAVPVPGPAPCAGTGRRRAGDVVLGAPGADGGRRLRVDPGHPIYFDHPVDHVPGVLLLEACHQAAGGTVRSLDCTFHRFVELDAPCTIATAPLGSGPRRAGQAAGGRRITAVQDGQVRFTADLVGAFAD
ncbi:ScbA/BarX family gamma-butyrolactone biosynthesis protein [Kitasatospora sp. NPDC091335]|uniref:ScbA/BarX family gamma-butyrolactone biosynthesis protein n=1 Tax=Kitasatospora sp. NPDC091335 TaxID=3364085 RepID=UPI0038076AE0